MSFCEKALQNLSVESVVNTFGQHEKMLRKLHTSNVNEQVSKTRSCELMMFVRLGNRKRIGKFRLNTHYPSNSFRAI